MHSIVSKTNASCQVHGDGQVCARNMNPTDCHAATGSLLSRGSRPGLFEFNPTDAPGRCIGSSSPKSELWLGAETFVQLQIIPRQPMNRIFLNGDSPAVGAHFRKSDGRGEHVTDALTQCLRIP